jgi:DNA-directed RNA polymerase subunit RPC12/RpoP
VSDAAVEILRCAACGGAVPLGEGDAARCPFCAAAVPIPAAHRALRDAERADAATRGDAEAYYAKLAAPPGAFIRALGRPNVSLAFVLLSPVLLIVAMIAGMVVMAIAAHAVHEDFVDLHSPKWNDVYRAAITSVMLVGFALLGALGRRYARGRTLLRTALAAKPPERPGGPALCRACGAPLVVPAGALGTRCTYCRADNLIIAGAGAAATDAADQRKVRRAMVEAEREERADRSRVIWSIIFRFVLVSVLLVPIWVDPLRDEGTMHDTTDYDDHVSGVRTKTLATGPECKDAITSFALRHREHLHGTREGGGAYDVRLWAGEKATSLIDERTWAAGTTFDFVAPHSGFFWICVYGPTPAPVTFVVSSR